MNERVFDPTRALERCAGRREALRLLLSAAGTGVLGGGDAMAGLVARAVDGLPGGRGSRPAAGLPRLGRSAVPAALAAVFLLLFGCEADTAAPTPPGGGNGDPQGQIAFLSFAGGLEGSDIHVVNANGSNPSRLTAQTAHDSYRESGPSPWSPDGRRLLFTSDREGDERELFVMDADGSNQLQLTSNGSDDRQPAWSPDGARIVFSSDRDGDYEIYVMNVDGSGLVQLTHDSNGSRDDDPDWSPAGDRIAFVGDFNRAIFTMDPDGSDAARITFDADFVFIFSARWSPDGSRMLVHMRLGSSSDDALYVVNADGSGLEQIGSETNSDFTWSPDGSRVAFSSDRDGDEEIYVVNADGTGLVQLTDQAAIDGTPSWSPDGGWIAFMSNRSGEFQIHVMRSDGTGARQVTQHGHLAASPKWRP